MPLLPPARSGPDGKLIQPPAELLPMLLLNQPDSAWISQQLGRVLDGLANPSQSQLQVRFTATDLAYMRRQLADCAQFRLEPQRLRAPRLVVVPTDTIKALYRRGAARLKRQYGVTMYDYTVSDSLLRRFGSRQLYSFSGPLFTADHKRAVVTVATEDSWQTFVYRKTGSIWREEKMLEAGVSCR